MKAINLYGASGHAKVIADIIESMGYSVGEVYDDDPSKLIFRGMRITRNLDNGALWILAIGNNTIRQRIAQQFKLNYATVIHNSAIISPSVVIGEGTVCMAGAALNADAIIGSHCILNTSCRVDHDCRLADFVHISPGATLCGNVSVGMGTQIGAGAVVLPGIRIGLNCVVGAGATVIRSIPNGTTVVGSPARPLH